MSTEYTILKKDNLIIELEERSSKFSLDLRTEGLTPHKLHLDSVPEEDDLMAFTPAVITPAELVKMAMKMLTVATFCETDDVLRAALKDALEADSYLHRELKFLCTEPREDDIDWKGN